MLLVSKVLSKHLLNINNNQNIKVLIKLILLGH